MEWRIIPGFPDYEIGEDGQVRRITSNGRNGKAGAILRTGVSHNGYHHLDLYNADGKKGFRLNVLVALVFIGPRPSPKHHAAHWDGDKNNNRASNLRWATARENIADKERHGLVKRGEANPNNRLSEIQVIEIKQRLGNGCRPQRLAEQFGVHKTTISQIKRGITWRSGAINAC